MARIIQNKNTGSVVIHSIGTETLSIVGNTTTSNIAISDEVITGATIKQVWYGAESSNAHCIVQRGANTVGVYNGTGHISYSAFGSSLNLDPAANLVLTHTGGSNSYIMIELQKLGPLSKY